MILHGSAETGKSWHVTLHHPAKVERKFREGRRRRRRRQRAPRRNKPTAPAMNGNATVVAESFMSQTRLDQPFCVVPWTPPQPKEGPKLPKAPPRLRSWPDWRCQICRADKTPERRYRFRSRVCCGSRVPEPALRERTRFATRYDSVLACCGNSLSSAHPILVRAALQERGPGQTLLRAAAAERARAAPQNERQLSSHRQRVGRRER